MVLTRYVTVCFIDNEHESSKDRKLALIFTENRFFFHDSER